MPENTENEFAVEMSQLRAQALEDLSRAEEEPEAELVVASFREGMSAGLDFAYRVVYDFRNTLPSAGARGLVDRVLEVLVSEHDMRSTQPIRAIRAEHATAQASDEMLAGLSEALMTVQPTPDPGPVTIGPDPTRCTCGRFWLNDPRGTVVAPSPGGAIRHRASGPCFLVVADPEPENVQAASDDRATLRLEHSCVCGEMPGLVSGVVTEGIGGGEVVYHRADGPCVLGSDLAASDDTFTISGPTFTLMDEGES